MMTLRNVPVSTPARGVALMMAMLLAVFCLSSVIPAWADATGCQGPAPSPRMCGQSGGAGVVDHVVAVADQISSVQWQPAYGGSIGFSFPAEPLSQFHAGPPAQRAPPFSLA